MRFLKNKNKNKQIDVPESLALGAAEQPSRNLSDNLQHSTLDSVCDNIRLSMQSTRKSSLSSSSKAGPTPSGVDYSSAIDTIVSLCGEAPVLDQSAEKLRKNSEANIVLDDKWEDLLSALSH